MRSVDENFTYCENFTGTALSTNIPTLSVRSTLDMTISDHYRGSR
jgi:hypothetical protein